MGQRMRYKGKKKHVKKLQNTTDEAQNEYRGLKKAVKKAVSRAMKEEAVRKIELGKYPINVFRLV